MRTAQQTNERLADASWGYSFGELGTLSVADACSFIGVHRTTLYRYCNRHLIRKGRLPGSRAVRICKRSLTEFVRSMEV